MPTPLTPIQVMQLSRVAEKLDDIVLTDAVSAYPELPKPKARPRKERSEPVRNPAFRESEALRELQRKLHTQNK
jgi:hypothetical protein